MWSDSDLETMWRECPEFAPPPSVVRKLATKAAELLAARGGTMHRLDIQSVLRELDGMAGDAIGPHYRLHAHILAQGARIAALEKHISDLEKSLENARRERDDLARRLKDEQDEVELTQAALNGISRLKPTGQVAEAERKVRVFCRIDGGDVSSDDDLVDRDEATAAVALLAAKAQGYEAFASACREALGPHRSTGTPADVALLNKDLEAARAFSVQFGHEREAAVADNVEMMRLIVRYANGGKNGACVECGNIGHHHVQCEIGRVSRDTHPGTALLERMKRLEGAVNELATTAWDVSQHDKMIIYVGGRLQRSVRAVSALLTTQCADASCVRCRSGEPCH